MIRSALRTQAAGFCEDPNYTRFAPSEYNTALNRAQEQFAMDSRCTFKDHSDSIVSGTASYSLPSDFMYEDWVLVDGIELAAISRHRLQAESDNSDWTAVTGKPTHFIIDPEQARRYITFYPKPDTSGDPVLMRYFAIPAEMTSDADVPLNSSSLLIQFHLALAAYAAWLLLQNMETSDKIEVKKRNLLQIYQDHVAKCMDTFKNTVSEPIRMRPG